MAVTIRPAVVDDLSQIQSIFEHYVLNTVTSFLIQKPPPDYIRTRFDSSIERGLPYLVAVEPGSGVGKVVGYTYASAFRGFMLGYGHTVEMTIYCHPDHIKRGIGGLLMGEMLKRLKTAKHTTMEAGHEDNVMEYRIKRLMAIMAVDKKGPDQGLALRDWYIKWGFEEVGRLRGVGFKKDRILDTMYLELNLEAGDFGA